MLIAGVDAGGSETRCLMLKSTGEVLGRASTGPANLQITGLIKTKESIERVLKKVLSGTDASRIDLLGVGVAGAGRTEDRDRLYRALSALDLVNRLYIADDGYIAALAARGGAPGLVLIAGTGAIVYGIQQTGNCLRTGGWGPLIGDEGSGYWLGLQAIKALIKCREQRGARTALEEIILSQLKLESLEGLIPFFYDRELPRQQVAGLAPAVIEQARAGDMVATAILDRGVEELINLVSGASRMLPFKENHPVVMGGLFNNSYFREIFAGRLEQTLSLKVRCPLFPAVAGGIILACLQSGFKPGAIRKLLAFLKNERR